MAKVFKSFRDESRTDWGQTVEENQKPTREDVQYGAILRIADSVEAMAKPFTELVEENERLKKVRLHLYSQIHKLEKRVAAYKGVINRMKKQK